MKTTDDLDAFFGAPPATEQRNPVQGMWPENTTEQLGAPGPSHDRLPHFRLGFTPSGGDELQTEYAVAREHGTAAMEALRELGPLVTPLLLISEIRSVAADTLWLSPFYERDSITFHFTWKLLGREVHAVLPHIEHALVLFAPRPHWGKLFADAPDYPQLPGVPATARAPRPDEELGNAFEIAHLERLPPRPAPCRP